MSPERAASAGSAPSSQTTCSARHRPAAAVRRPSQTRVRPQASARRSRSTVRGVVGRARRPAARRRAGPAAATAPRRPAPSTCTAGSARLPTMTGWTNSTATWRPWAGHCGATHHMVAPAANRRASVSAAAARSSAGRVRSASTGRRRPRPPSCLRPAPAARYPATAAWPRASPPSLGGTRRWVEHPQAARAKLGPGQADEQDVLEHAPAQRHPVDPGRLAQLARPRRRSGGPPPRGTRPPSAPAGSPPRRSSTMARSTGAGSISSPVDREAVVAPASDPWPPATVSSSIAAWAS